MREALPPFSEHDLFNPGRSTPPIRRAHRFGLWSGCSLQHSARRPRHRAHRTTERALRRRPGPHPSFCGRGRARRRSAPRVDRARGRAGGLRNRRLRHLDIRRGCDRASAGRHDSRDPAAHRRGGHIRTRLARPPRSRERRRHSTRLRRAPSLRWKGLSNQSHRRARGEARATNGKRNRDTAIPVVSRGSTGVRGSSCSRRTQCAARPTLVGSQPPECSAPRSRTTTLGLVGR